MKSDPAPKPPPPPLIPDEVMTSHARDLDYAHKLTRVTLTCQACGARHLIDQQASTFTCPHQLSRNSFQLLFPGSGIPSQAFLFHPRIFFHFCHPRLLFCPRFYILCHPRLLFCPLVFYFCQPLLLFLIRFYTLRFSYSA